MGCLETESDQIRWNRKMFRENGEFEERAEEVIVHCFRKVYVKLLESSVAGTVPHARGFLRNWHCRSSSKLLHAYAWHMHILQCSLLLAKSITLEGIVVARIGQ